MQAIKATALVLASILLFVLAVAIATVIAFAAALCVYLLVKDVNEPLANNASWIAFGATWITVFRAWAEVTS